MIGHINSIETMGLVDGPGIRFVVFMQGCKLRCVFCHNPETWSFEGGMEITPQELVKRILRYHTYFGEEGGVTFSGGEPLQQPEFLLETLKLCKQCNIHTCLDTAGFGECDYEEILKYTDLVMMDIKALKEDKYQDITGKKIEESLNFIKACQRLGKKMWIRQVIIPGINDTEEYVLELKEFLSKLKNVEKVEFLPYETLGIPKYKNLNLPYRLENVEAMDKEKCKKLYELLKK